MQYQFNGQGHSTELKKSGIEIFLNENLVDAQIQWIKPGKYAHILLNNNGYTLLVNKIDSENKTIKISVNGSEIELQAKDHMDKLLVSLGLDKLMHKKVSEIKAPMPGLVLKVVVSPGSSVQKGETLLVLEAMKMENSIKSPIDGVVKSIKVEAKQAVEKNQILVEFE